MNDNALNRRDFLREGGTMALAVAGAASAAQGEKGEPKMLRVAMLSQWHPHAKGYGNRLSNMADVKITTVWDETPERGRLWAESLKAEFEPDLGAVLARDNVDAVVCNAPSNRHAEIMTAAANARKHVFTEKVMALTVAECNQISEAVKRNGVKFCISLPYRTRPEVLYAYQAVQEGLLGHFTSLRVRVAHNGGSGGWLPAHFWDPASCGGGAMIDLGAHPMYLARWFGGRPKRIASTFTRLTNHEVEDNAISVIEFENALIGVAETSFVSSNSPFSLELSGTEGSLIAGGPDEKSVRIRSNKLDARNWITPDKLPDELPNPIQMWVDGILRDAPIYFDTEEGTQLTELMQYAYQAHQEGRQIEIPTRAA